MNTTLNLMASAIGAQGLFESLLTMTGKTAPDDAPLPVVDVLDALGLDAALACLNTVQGRGNDIGRFTAECVRFIRSLLVDPRAVAILDTAASPEVPMTTEALAAVENAAMQAIYDAPTPGHAMGVGIAASVRSQSGASILEAVQMASTLSARSANGRASARNTMRARQAAKLRELCALPV